MTPWVMQHVGLVLVMVVSGCATSTAIGVQALATRNDGRSLEGTVAAGLGMGDADRLYLLRADAALGVAQHGGLQGRIQLGGEGMARGTKAGWHLRGGLGGSFGAYQSPDLTVQLSGGPHWNLHRSKVQGIARITSIAFDATIGYGFRIGGPDGPIDLDGPFFGVGLSLRRDTVELFELW